MPKLAHVAIYCGLVRFERSPDIRLGGVIYQGHTALTDYHSTPFQVLCLLDFEYVCFERRTVSFFTQFNSGIFPWY
jgi:hypothetical protein